MKPSELLQLAKQGLGVETDGELGRAFGWESGKVSQYKTNKKWPDNTAARKLAEAAGLPWAEVIAALECEKAKDEQTRTDWGKALASLRRSAAVLVLAVLASLAAVSSPLQAPGGLFRRLKLSII